jgi:polyhydroxybutyrate depolymerase
MQYCKCVWMIVVAFVVAAFLTGAALSEKSSEGRDIEGRFRFQGLERSYLLHLPPEYDPAKPVPLVVALHCYSGTGGAEAEQSLFSEKADAEGFIVVYPNGAIPAAPGFAWNFGPMRRRGRPDDVAFVAEVIRRLPDAHAIDPKRIYVTGMSQGGMLAHAVGCELSHVVAAVAPVGAALVTEPRRREPLSVLIIHGTEDPSVPYEGGQSGGEPGRRPFPPVSHAVSTWVEHKGCSPTPTRAQDGLVIREVYTGGTAGTEVALCAIVGGRHDWPGDNNDSTGAGLVGADAIWEFFEQHPKQ